VGNNVPSHKRDKSGNGLLRSRWLSAYVMPSRTEGDPCKRRLLSQPRPEETTAPVQYGSVETFTLSWASPVPNSAEPPQRLPESPVSAARP